MEGLCSDWQRLAAPALGAVGRGVGASMRVCSMRIRSAALLAPLFGPQGSSWSSPIVSLSGLSVVVQGTAHVPQLSPFDEQ